MEKTNFGVIREKIIKTDELLRMYEDKSTKLIKANRAYKDVKTKYEESVAEVNRLKLDNERSSFNLISMKSKYDPAETEIKNLKEQYAQLEDKYNKTVIESQLNCQALEEKMSNCTCEDRLKSPSPEKKKPLKEARIKELQEKCKEYKNLLSESKKENAKLVIKNKQLSCNFVDERNQHNAIMEKLRLENLQFSSDIKMLKEMLKKTEVNAEESNNFEQVKQEKDLEINELRKKIVSFTLQKDKYKKLETENVFLKNEVMELEKHVFSENDKQDIATQVNFKPIYVNKTVDAEKEIVQEREKDICNVDENSSDVNSVYDILNEMYTIPIALSPMSFSSNENDNMDTATTFVDSLLPDPKTTITPLNIDKPSQNIPDIIITPPTPNILTNENKSPNFSVPENQNKEEPLRNKVTEKIASKKSQTLQRRKYRTPFIRTEFVKLRRRRKMLLRNSFNHCIESQHDTILKALRTLKDNNINFTISNESIPLMPYNIYNTQSLMYPPKIEKSVTIPKKRTTVTQVMTCWCEKCNKDNSYIISNGNEELLGFFNVKNEVVTPAVSRMETTQDVSQFDTKSLLHQVLDGIKQLITTKNEENVTTKVGKRKRKRRANSEFNSETESELEKLFNKNSVLSRNKRLLEAAKHQKRLEQSGIESNLESDTETFVDDKMESVASFTEETLNPVEENSKGCFKIPGSLSPLASSANGSPPEQNKASSSRHDNNIKENSNDCFKIPGILSPFASIAKGNPPEQRRHDQKMGSSIVQLPPEDNSWDSFTCPKLLSPLAASVKGSPPTRTSLRKRTCKSLLNDLNLPEEMAWKTNIADKEAIFKVPATKEAMSPKSKRGRPAKSKEFISDVETDSDSSMSNSELERRRLRPRKNSNTSCKEIIDSAPLSQIKSLVGAEILKKKELTRESLYARDISDTDEPILNPIAEETDTAKVMSGKKEVLSKKVVKPKRKATKLRSLVLQQAKAKAQIFKKESNICDLTANASKTSLSDTESSKESLKSVDSGFSENSFTNRDTKKIKIVHDILIAKTGSTVNMLKGDKTVKLTSQNSSQSSLVNKNDKRFFETQNRVSPVKKKAKRIVQSTETDIVSKLIGDMVKTRTNFKRPTCLSRRISQSNQQAGCRESLESARRKNIEEGNGNRDENADNEFLDCPKSPETVEVPDCPPKIIPTEKVTDLLPPSKVLALFEKLLMYSNEDKVLDEIVKQFIHQDVGYIARIILERVARDTTEKATNQFAPAPVLTNTQRVLLGFMARLERENVSNVYQKFLSKAEMELFNSKICQLQMVQPVTRLYVAVCKLRKDINRVRRFCAEAFYFMGDLAVPLFFTVLTMWPEVLPQESESQDFPMAKVLVQLCFLKECNTPGYNLLPLRGLLHQFFGYPNERYNCDEVFQEIFIQYLRNPSLRLSDFTLLVFCKNKPVKWVYSKLKLYVMPLVSKIPAENSNLKATVIILLGNICHCFKKRDEYENSVIGEMRNYFNNLEEDTTSDTVKRAIYLAVTRLPRLPKGLKKKQIEKKVENKAADKNEESASGSTKMRDEDSEKIV